MICYVLSPGLDQSLAIAKFLYRYRPEFQIIGCKMVESETFYCKKYFSHFISLKELKTPPSEHAIYIPTGARSTKWCLEQYGQVRLGEITLTDRALRVYDKVTLLQVAKNIGIPVPTTWVSLGSVEKFPIFCKPCFEGLGKLRTVIWSLDDAKRKLSGSENLYIFQEYIQSEGTYGVGFLADSGNILVEFIHFEVESIPPQGGSAVIIEQFYDRRLIDYTRALITELGYSGWGLAEFKYCPKREDYVLMEINGKFWASCEFAFINEPAFLKLLFGINSIERPVRRMVFGHRAILRGPLFMAKNFSLLYKSKWVFYPGWWRNLIAAFKTRLWTN